VQPEGHPALLTRGPPVIDPLEKFANRQVDQFRPFHDRATSSARKYQELTARQVAVDLERLGKIA
jgi:hypothetical protein